MMPVLKELCMKENTAGTAPLENEVQSCRILFHYLWKSVLIFFSYTGRNIVPDSINRSSHTIFFPSVRMV